MTPEERAKAVVAYFPAIPERLRAEMEAVISRAIHRAIKQALSQLEECADRESVRAEGKGKQAKGRDPAAIFWHRWWKLKLQRARLHGNMHASPHRNEVGNLGAEFNR